MCPCAVDELSTDALISAVPLAAQQPTRLQARIDTAYSTDWTPEEQVALDATLDKYPAARHSALERYLRAAAALPKKTARDVALRVKWLATSAHASKRRLADDGAAKKRPRVQSIFAVQPKGAPPLGIPAPGVPAPGVPVAPLQQVSHSFTQLQQYLKSGNNMNRNRVAQ